MYKPSINALIEIIKKAQSDVVELDQCLTILAESGQECFTVIRVLQNARQQQRAFMADMFNEITSHDDQWTEEQAAEVAELQRVYEAQR